MERVSTFGSRLEWPRLHLLRSSYLHRVSEIGDEAPSASASASAYLIARPWPPIRSRRGASAGESPLRKLAEFCRICRSSPEHCRVARLCSALWLLLISPLTRQRMVDIATRLRERNVGM
jgi:hypothetical protein